VTYRIPVPFLPSYPAGFVHQFAVGKFQVFRVVAPCRLVNSYLRFGGMDTFVVKVKPQGLLDPEEGGTAHLQPVGNKGESEISLYTCRK